jgi:glucokinase
MLETLTNGNLETLTALQISQAAVQGDELAQQALRQSGWALGIGIGNVANLINPQRFVLGGGVTKSGELFWQTLQQTARQTALPEVHFEIVPAALGDDAPLWGAIVLAEALAAETL